MKKKSTIFWLITAFCLAATVGLWFAVNGEKVEYTEVEATVVRADTYYRKIAGTKRAVYEVTVRYNGATYELENVYGTAGYISGRNITAYEANGHLYANVAGVKTSTPLSTVYFVFLFGTFGLFGVSVYLMSKEQQRKKEAQTKVSGDLTPI